MAMNRIPRFLNNMALRRNAKLHWSLHAGIKVFVVPLAAKQVIIFLRAGSIRLFNVRDLLPNNAKISKNVLQQQTSKKTMLNLNRIDKKYRLMRATIGLTLKQFDELLGDFDSAYEKAMDADRSKRGCERKKGAGKKPRLASTRFKLFFVLIYLKCYPTYDVLGSLFDLDSGTIVIGSNACCPFWRRRWAKNKCCSPAKSVVLRSFYRFFHTRRIC